MIAERGREDWESELGRFPRLFEAADSVPGLTWPTITFKDHLTVYLGKRRVDLRWLGRGHTAGDVVVWVPDAEVLFSGDLVEHRSACYCGDAYLQDWPATLDRLYALVPRALVPGRGPAVQSRADVDESISCTREFVSELFHSVSRRASAGASLKECFEETNSKMSRRYAQWAIFDHCMPFNVARAYDEARGVETPRIWTASRDREVWAALQ
jgi:glyoxylase-like metal-dependent hydrolase (beta-lactamase superfamily II)